VLVHGSGPSDRDATFGPNKPFRDLALGLASRGIATLRYEKRTRQHGLKIAGSTDFTVKEETVDDAVAAVRLLRTTAGVAPGRVFVIGHSLGGMLAPRIAAAAGTDVAGLIIMAGAVRSLEQSVLDQTRYLSLADGTISPDEQSQIDQLTALVAKVATLRATDPPVSIAGARAPASYWVDLRGYNSVAAARALKRPMLILQGERDYQVTTDDFAQWKAALGARPDVVLKSYPALNHLFIAGTGKSLPGEYLQAGHVAADVVSDIAAWIAAR
jgi:alpha-beta hydrolase superfamily lysophospholipase